MERNGLMERERETEGEVNRNCRFAGIGDLLSQNHSSDVTLKSLCESRTGEQKSLKKIVLFERFRFQGRSAHETTEVRDQRG